jgi:hypothetical protein
VHSFRTLLGDLATIVKNRIQPADPQIAAFDMLTHPTAIQQHAFDLLGVALRMNWLAIQLQAAVVGSKPLRPIS